MASVPGPRGGSLACNAGVRGLALLDGYLYVLQVGRQTTDIAVHDASLSLKRLPAADRRLTIPGLRDASDLAACGRHRCLYVTDVGCDCVHRVYGLDATLSFQSWPVGDKPWGLSVTTVCVQCVIVYMLLNVNKNSNVAVGTRKRAVRVYSPGRVWLRRSGVPRRELRGLERLPLPILVNNLRNKRVRMRQNMIFPTTNTKNFLGRGTAHYPDPFLSREAPPILKSWVRHCCDAARIGRRYSTASIFIASRVYLVCMIVQ